MVLAEIVETILNLTKEDLVCRIVVFKYLEQEIRSKEKPDYRKGMYSVFLQRIQKRNLQNSSFYLKI